LHFNCESFLNVEDLLEDGGAIRDFDPSPFFADESQIACQLSLDATPL
jgi:hypothetical protein